MRHRIGIVLAVVMIGVLFFPGAWGYLRLLRLPAPVGQLSQLPAGGGSLLSDHNVLIALAAITGTGLLAGVLIAAPRISPLAAGLPGLLLLGWTALYLVNVRQGVDLIPLRSDPFGAGFEAMLFNGILGAAGLAMILPMFVPSRWRARRTDAGEATVADEFTTGPGETTKTPVATKPAQLTPVRTASLAPLPAGPWPAASQPVNELATERPRQRQNDCRWSRSPPAGHARGRAPVNLTAAAVLGTGARDGLQDEVGARRGVVLARGADADPLGPGPGCSPAASPRRCTPTPPGRWRFSRRRSYSATTADAPPARPVHRKPTSERYRSPDPGRRPRRT